MTHKCVGNLPIIGSDNGLSPGRPQAITWTNIGILLIGPLGTNFSEMLIEIDVFSFKKMHLKVSSAKRRPFCLGLNVLMIWLLLGDWGVLTETGCNARIVYRTNHSLLRSSTQRRLTCKNTNGCINLLLYITWTMCQDHWIDIVFLSHNARALKLHLQCWTNYVRPGNTMR